MAQHGRAERGKTYVESHRELATTTTADSLDDRDGCLRQGSDPLRHRVEERQFVVQCGVRSFGTAMQVAEQRDVRMRDEELRIGRVDDQHPHPVVAGDFPKSRSISVSRGMSSKLIGG